MNLNSKYKSIIGMNSYLDIFNNTNSSNPNMTTQKGIPQGNTFTSMSTNQKEVVNPYPNLHIKSKKVEDLKELQDFFKG